MGLLQVREMTLKTQMQEQEIEQLRVQVRTPLSN